MKSGIGGAGPAPIQLQIERVRPGIYHIPIFNQSVAPAATTTVFVTKNHGVVVVDTKNPGSGQAIIDLIKKVTDKPITSEATPARRIIGGNSSSMVSTCRAYADATRKAKKDGKTLEQAIMEVPMMMGPKYRDYFAGLYGRNPGTTANVTMMWAELDKEPAKK